MGNTGSSEPVDMNGKEAMFVRDTIASNKVVIFSKTYCPYCDTAKKIFSQLGVPTKVIELDHTEGGGTIQMILGNLTNARTVPRVFVNGECIGGASETKSLNNSGQLKVLLEEGSG